MNKHYLNYLTDVISHQWNDPALTDYNENHEYTFGELAIEMLRLHVLFEQIGIKRGDKIALAGRNCANWAVAYLAIVAAPMAVNGQDDAAKAQWFPLSALPELAFDHDEIMHDAIKKYKEIVNDGLI